MTLEKMMIELRSTGRERCLYVRSYEYEAVWTVTLEIKFAGDEVKITRDSPSLLAAVTDVYNAYRASQAKPFAVFTSKQIEAA